MDQLVVGDVDSVRVRVLYMNSHADYRRRLVPKVPSVYLGRGRQASVVVG